MIRYDRENAQLDEQTLKSLALSPFIRAKVLVTSITDPDQRLLFERVGQQVLPYPMIVWPKDLSKVPCSGIFIGPELDPTELLAITREHLQPDCHFANSCPPLDTLHRTATSNRHSREPAVRT